MNFPLTTADRRYELRGNEVIDRQANDNHGGFVGYAAASISPRHSGQFYAVPYNGDTPERVEYFTSLQSAFEYVCSQNQVRAHNEFLKEYPRV